MQGLGLFPGGRSAAVSFTYDDALDAHLDHAMPDLEAAGLRGTFYTPMNGPGWASRLDDWRAAASRGHELGNHTKYHPCSIEHGFIKPRPNFSLEAYNLTRIEAELGEADAELDAVAGRVVRSYAYTCCEDFVGPDRQSYRPTVARRFPAARGGGDAVADPWGGDLAFVPSLVAVERHDGAALIEFVDRAVESGGWAVIQFHGVGGGHNLNVRRAAHQAVCQHVARRADQVWCDTFVNVALHVRSASGRAWTGRK